MKKNNNIFATIVLTVIRLIIMSILVYCLYQIIPKLLEYKESDDVYERIRKEAIKENPDSEDTEAETSTDKEESEKQETETEDESLKKALHIDWEKFKGTDIVGWLQLDNISYPILQAEDNQTYLHHLPDGTYNYGGSIFLYSHNSPLFTDEASFIYGHNMANGSMFGLLKKYMDSKYKDHSFYIYLPDGTRKTYKFYSVISVPEGSFAYQWSFKDIQSFVEWQNKILESTMYSNSQTPSIDAQYTLLSTCNGPTGTSQRLLVVGQYEKTEQIQEKASWYDNYLEDLQFKEYLRENET